MEQEQVMDKGARVTLETGKQLFQFLAYALSQGAKAYKEHRQTGEQSWKNFIKSPHTKDHITFEEAEVNFDKLKKEFKKSGVNFHFTDNKDGTKTVWFEAINQKIIQEALRKINKEIISDPKAATEKFMKKPNELTPKQQIEKIKGAVKKSTEAVKNKKKGKSI
ncbi:DUF3801 domain-containing protein [Streptococcus agalactiae]|uniref:DUF3801 domain-containing protein n=1 Tax=Streptococcus agalactiae TaxID=1311 RepID=UPI00186703D4|nr:DUF3801 domain-containing protein [Streptococcus agalactiae]MBE3600756.1 DUF3801 domain-containing protein [Streptococcus agalactiae]